jgi:hypothetical protein
MTILLFLLFLAGSSYSFGQITLGNTGLIQGLTDEASTIRMINTLGMVSAQLTNPQSMKRTAVLGGLCLPCWHPVALQMSSSATKQMKRWCKQFCKEKPLSQ